MPQTCLRGLFLTDLVLTAHVRLPLQHRRADVHDRTPLLYRTESATQSSDQLRAVRALGVELVASDVVYERYPSEHVRCGTLE